MFSHYKKEGSHKSFGERERSMKVKIGEITENMGSEGDRLYKESWKAKTNFTDFAVWLEGNFSGHYTYQIQS